VALVVAAILLWIAINVAVVLADLALVLREDRAARRVAGGSAGPPARQPQHH
jgi:hypothetical protein